MAKPKKNTTQEKPKLRDILAAYHGLGGPEQAKAAAQRMPDYAEEIRAGMKKAGKVVYAGEVATGNELLEKAVAEIMTSNPYSETVKGMFGVLAIGETFGYDKMTLGGSYEKGVELQKEKLKEKVVGDAKGLIKEFEEKLELPADATSEEREALKAAKQFGIKASYAEVAKHMPAHASYAGLAEAYVHMNRAPLNIARLGAEHMANYVEGLRKGREEAAKKKAGIPGEK